MVLLVMPGCASGAEQRAPSPPDASVAAELRLLLGGTEPRIAIGGETLDAAPLRAFYTARSMTPAWNAGGRAVEVQGLLSRSWMDGLNPASLHAGAIAERLASSRPAARAEADLLLSAGAALYLAQVQTGRMAPYAKPADGFYASHPQPGMLGLADILASREPATVLGDAALRSPAYAQLRRQMAHYLEIRAAGGWQPVPGGPLLRPGRHSDQLPALRARLKATGDLAADAAAPEDATLYDDAAAEGLRRFQARHGLKEDGILGPDTLAALNVTVDERILQIMANMERWRWLPSDFQQRSILVNIAGFELAVFEAGRTVMTMKIIIGLPYRETPIFSSRMRDIVFSPDWTVPPTILRNSFLPELRRNPGFIDEHELEVYDGWGRDSVRLDPETIDWNSAGARGYRYRQAPGPRNPLGQIKFLFPNDYSVYLHDTSNPELFDEPMRAFSSGCIRLEKPRELAAWVLRDVEGWDLDRINATIATGQTRSFRLPESARVLIYVTYTTAWRAADGTDHFRRDIYGRDTSLEKELSFTIGG
jgi:murein L,D-transpeptidase YcbB/YkuD